MMGKKEMRAEVVHTSDSRIGTDLNNIKVVKIDIFWQILTIFIYFQDNYVAKRRNIYYLHQYTLYLVLLMYVMTRPVLRYFPTLRLVHIYLLVIHSVYCSGSLILMQRSSEMAHRLRMEAVEHITSELTRKYNMVIREGLKKCGNFPPRMQKHMV